jgi:UDP-N-acetylglucosamine 2-epimerase (non-hydrolysing)
MKKILLVFGTRPEAIKMAPLVKEFQKYKKNFETRVCVTAQHRQMLDQVLNIFAVQPDYDLDIMAPNQDLFDITSKVLLGMRDILNDFIPDIVFVHGDTTTSLAASLASFYKHIKVAHIEAGLRTYNLQSPWPEEMNRQVTDKVADYYFAPTELAKNNLLHENILPENIYVTGNTVIDALFLVIDLINSDKKVEKQIIDSIENKGYPIMNGRKYILVTGHRRENFGKGFLDICNAIKEIALSRPNIDIVYPVHLNPNVQKPVFDILSVLDNVFLISPIDYLPFIYLMQNSYLILTDSGGIQEEAPSLGKPVLVMRDTTERPEAINAGTVKLVGTNIDSIVNNINLLLDNSCVYEQMSQAVNPYGNGKACKKIIDVFIK